MKIYFSKTITYLFLLVGGILCALPTQAQQSTPPDSLDLTVTEAIQLGLANRKDLQNLQLAIDLQANELEKIRARNLPQVTATVDARINTQLQTNVLPGSIFGENQEDRAIRFGTPFNNLLAINLNQNVYNPNLQIDREIGQARQEIEQSNLSKTTIHIKLSIAQAYYNALLNQIKLQTSRYNLEQAEAFYKKAQNDFKQGKLLAVDAERRLVDYQNAQHSQRNDENLFQLALAALANQLGLIDVKRPLKLSDNLDALFKSDSISNNSNTQTRIEVQLEERQLKLNELNLLKQQRLYRPTVGAYANYSLQQLSSQLNPFKANTWFPYNYLGLRLDVPIFDGFLKERTKQEYRLRMEQNKNTLAKLQSDIAYEQTSADIEMKNAQNNLQQAQGTYQLAQKVLAVDKNRYNKGVLTLADLKNTEYSVQNAQNNYLNAVYQVLLARLNLLKANGRL